MPAPVCRRTGFSTSSSGSSRFTPIQSPPATRTVRSLDRPVRPALIIDQAEVGVIAVADLLP